MLHNIKSKLAKHHTLILKIKLEYDVIQNSNFNSIQNSNFVSSYDET